jgi:hypothetical protein
MMVMLLLVVQGELGVVVVMAVTVMRRIRRRGSWCLDRWRGKMR